MKTHTSSFKEQIKLIGKEIDSRITFGSTVLGKNDLNAVTPSYQGAILKSVMKQLDIDSNVEIPLGTILKYEFGLKVNGEYEYIDFGNYIVKEVEKQEDTNSYKLTCYDKMLYSMIDYEKMDITYPISIRDYIKAICDKLGLTFANASDTFANYDKQIQNELYLDENENSLGYTFRDVLDELSQVTASCICINNNDELEIRYINNTNDTIDEEFLKDVNVKFGEKFGAVNTIVLSRSAESDNVYYPEVLPENPYEFKISDNQIMNFNDRSDYLPDIYEKLNGLEFYINDFSSTGICYYELLDRYNVKVGDNTYSCVMFNDEMLVTQGLEENIFTEMPKETETDYTKADKTDRKINQVSLIVDKQKQEIKSIAEKVVDISNVIKGVGNITLENAYEGNLHKLTIKGNISLIYPSNDLYPSDNLYPKIFKLQVDEKIYELDLDCLNYINSNIYDEFVYENSKCYVIRRIGIDENGELYQLENEIIETKKDLIINVLENSKITLLGFENAILSVEYLLQNQYSNVFASEAYVNSEIKQTSDEINIEVSKKVNENEVVNAINISTDQVLLKGNRVIIESDNFDLDADGKITAIAGEIGGFNMNSQSFSKNLNGMYDYNQFDTILTAMSVLNRISIDNNLTAVLDVNNDKTITPVDYVTIKNILKGLTENTKILNGSFEINSSDPKNCISIKDSFGQIISSLGLGGINSTYVTCNNFICGYPSENASDFIGTTINGETGNITCVSLTQTSKKEFKKNFEKLENALDIIKKTDIYKYNLITEEDNSKKHIGFVIGDNYNYCGEITTEKNEGVDIYSMVSVCFKAIKEQQEQIELLKNEINQLKEMIK